MPVTPVEKQQAALRLMESKGLSKSAYNPLGLRLLWRMGINCPPPMMVTFAKNALVCGSYFGIVMGAVFASGLFRHSLESALVGGLSSGVLFGVAMATYFRSVRVKHDLPLWRDFKPAD